MPELPEVQIVRRFLEDICLRPKPKTIKSIKAFYPNIIKSPQPTDFINKLCGQAFTKIDRYGKYLILKFQKYSIISHLRMQGKYIFYNKKFVPQKHDHIQFLFKDDSSLIYNDVRKFGTMHLVNRGEQMQHISLSKLGPQVNNEQTFTPDYLGQIIQNSNKSIKELLLNQQKVCGIGNIYADQILYKAKIKPTRKSSSLGKQQIEDIVVFGKEIIDHAIEGKGTTIRSFSANHEAGEYQNSLNVYGRQGQKCNGCGGTINKIALGGRGTHFCNKCQK